MTKTKKIFDLFLIFLSLPLVLPLYLLITLLVLVQPSALIGIPIGLNTSELPIALKGYRGVCAYNIDFSDDNEFESSFIENWL